MRNFHVFNARCDEKSCQHKSCSSRVTLSCRFIWRSLGCTYCKNHVSYMSEENESASANPWSVKNVFLGMYVWEEWKVRAPHGYAFIVKTICIHNSKLMVREKTIRAFLFIAYLLMKWLHRTFWQAKPTNPCNNCHTYDTGILKYTTRFL